MGSGSGSSLEPPGRRRTRTSGGGTAVGSSVQDGRPGCRVSANRRFVGSVVVSGAPFSGRRDKIARGRQSVGLPGRDERRCVRYRTQVRSPGRALAMRAIKPIKRLVPVSCTDRSASTPGLSTWWSTTAFKGELILRWVSRLDAFSGYPDRT
jgi:hypothetical protein